MRAIVTRPAAEAAVWQLAMAEAGIDAVALPLIEIAPPPNTRALIAEWQRLATRRLVMFVSPNAVRGFFAVRPADAVPWPAGTMAACPGPGTAQALRGLGIGAASIVEPAFDAATFDSESLWERLHDRDWTDASVLVVRGDGGRDWLVGRLVDAGAKVDIVCAYRRHAPPWNAAAQRVVETAWREPATTAWVFSSAQAIDHLVEAAGSDRWAAGRAIATHARIAERARSAGFGDVREAAPTTASVIACIESMQP